MLIIDRTLTFVGLQGAIVSEEGLVLSSVSPASKRMHTVRVGVVLTVAYMVTKLRLAWDQVAELALNPELNRKMEAKKRNLKDKNFLAKNKQKTGAISRAVRRDREREQDDSGSSKPLVVAEGTRKHYNHVQSKFMKDAAVKGAPPPQKSQDHVEVRGNAWVPAAKGSVRRESTNKPRAPKRVPVQVEGGTATQPWNISAEERVRLEKLRSREYRERVKRAEEEDALVDHDPAWVRTQAEFGSKKKAGGRVLEIPQYIVDRKKELAAAREDQRKAAVDIDPDPPEGFRWMQEQKRKAEIRKWTVRKRDLQAELDSYARMKPGVPGLFKKQKEAELKMARTSEKLRLLGTGRPRLQVLTDWGLLNDPGCPLKIECSFVTGGKAVAGSIQRSRLYITTDTAKIKVEVNLTVCTVKQLKEKIEEKTGAPPRWQKLVYHGKTLADAKLLSHYGILKDAAIKLEMRAMADPIPPEHLRTQPPSVVKPPWALDR